MKVPIKLRLRGWKPITTDPKIRRKRILAMREDGWVFITYYRPDFVDGSGYGVVDSCCGYYEDQDPKYWKEIV